MRIVVSLGGSTLLDRGERADAYTQRRHVRDAAHALAGLAREHDLVVCHGNTAQIGTLALESENDDTLTRPYPLDVLGAQTQGMIGYWLVQEMHHAGLGRPAAALVTRTVVDHDDPGFRDPAAFVGPGYTREQVQLWAGQLGWRMAHDGHAWRRVVPSVAPVLVLELPVIACLVDSGTVVVCGGGGGVAVGIDDIAYEGLDAVVDADQTAALLAVELAADRLLLLTDVSDVRRHFGTGSDEPLRTATVSELVALPLDPATMGAKVGAAGRFVESTGRPACIGAVRDAARLLNGRAGTTVVPTWRSRE